MVFSSLFFGGIRCCPASRHLEVTVAVVVGFVGTDDGQNHQQGATFARADSQHPKELARPDHQLGICYTGDLRGRHRGRGSSPR